MGLYIQRENIKVITSCPKIQKIHQILGGNKEDAVEPLRVLHKENHEVKDQKYISTEVNTHNIVAERKIEHNLHFC